MKDSDKELFEKYWRDVRSYAILGKEEEEKLFREYAVNGSKKAFDSIFYGNLKLAIKIAFFYKKRHPSASIMDLIQEANVGLMEAIKKFDVGNGVKFSTHAYLWMRQKIFYFILKNRTIRLPYSFIERLKKFKEEEKVFQEKHKRPPSIQEMAKIMKISKERATDCALFFYTKCRGVEDIFEAYYQSGEKETREKDITLFCDKDFLEANNKNPEAIVIRIDNRRDFKKNLSTLKKRRREIIEKLFEGDKNMSQIARESKTSPQNIQQIASRALKKLAKLAS